MLGKDCTIPRNPMALPPFDESSKQVFCFAKESLEFDALFWGPFV
jgi:hypothetical protein